jgi:hypothetical protein
MHETLDDSIFADLDHAYGSAADVPGHLRALASDDLDAARDALHELGAAIYHQGSYFSATAPSIPFLIELADAAISARAEVLLFLADMSGAPGDPDLAFQPYLFSSSPGRPNYPEAVATIAAIQRGRETYLRALSSDDARARACAAALLVALGDPELAGAIERALATETDEHARVAMSFACSRMGLRLAPVVEPAGLVADVVASLRADVDPNAALAGLARLLRLDSKFASESIPYFEGDLTRFAALALVQQFARDPRAFDVAADALADRLARGERIQTLPHHCAPRIGDETPSADEPIGTSFATYLTDVPLRSIAGAMAAIAFGERAHDRTLLCRDELDDRMRRVLLLTVEHGIPVPIAGAPWIEASEMARFLNGGGPLDERFEWQGANEPLYLTLTALAGGQDPNEHEAEVDQLFAQLAELWSPERLIALAIDIVDNGYGLAPYGPPQPTIRAAIAKYITPLGDRYPEQFDAYAERLLLEDHAAGARVELAFGRAIAAKQPVEPRFDRLARSAIASNYQHGRDWLLCFPEPRRSQMVAAWGNGHLYNRFLADCDRATLEDALIAGFLASECRWYEHEAETLIATITDETKLERLREQSTGRRRVLVDRVLARS